MVHENRKGNENCYLLTFKDYMDRLVKEMADSFADIVVLVEKIFTTKLDKGKRCEISLTSNDRRFARFASNLDALKGFLLDASAIVNPENLGEDNALVILNGD